MQIRLLTEKNRNEHLLNKGELKYVMCGAGIYNEAMG